MCEWWVGWGYGPTHTVSDLVVQSDFFRSPVAQVLQGNILRLIEEARSLAENDDPSELTLTKLPGSMFTINVVIFPEMSNEYELLTSALV